MLLVSIMVFLSVGFWDIWRWVYHLLFFRCIFVIDHMGSVIEEKIKTTSAATAGLINMAAQPTNTLLEEMKALKEFQDQSG